MIFNLTVAKLSELGFSEESIDRLLNWENHTSTILKDKENSYYASNTDKKIYTGTDAIRKHHFRDNYTGFPFEDPSLIPEYFEIKKDRYIKEKRATAGSIFIEKNAVERFKQCEITWAENIIKENRRFAGLKEIFAKRIEIATTYIDWINRPDDSGRMEIKSDSLSFIEPLVIKSFLEAESKALGMAGKFESVIRCAAFCELLWTRKHITHTNTRQVTMNDFAKSRYGIDIKNSLATTKKEAREKHKTKKVKGLIPLRDCF